ncbi:M4 family metallopeptidase [Streptomyces sp. NPDC001675]
MRPNQMITAAALMGAVTLLAGVIPAHAATAPAVSSASAGKTRPLTGAVPAKMSPARQAELIASARSATGHTSAALGLGGKERLIARSVSQDADGSLHTRYERTFDGLPVLGGDLIVHTTPDGDSEGVDKATEARISVPSTVPARSASSAKDSALRSARADGIRNPVVSGTRTVVWAATGHPALAWETVAGGEQRDGTPSELHVITDAASGAKLFAYQAVTGFVSTGDARTTDVSAKSAAESSGPAATLVATTGVGYGQYDGRVSIASMQERRNLYYLEDNTRGDHRTYDMAHATDNYATGTLFEDRDNVWGDGTPANVQTAGVDAAHGAQLVWDYYKDTYGRLGPKADGVSPISRVHFSSGYANAYFNAGCKCVTYGDGAGDVHPLTSIDVTAHEMTHGLTYNTANLAYSGESGGLNEATSDIFATATEFDAANPVDSGDYILGEKLQDGRARHQDQPSLDGVSADYWYSGIDRIDVHYSSGPANHFFYLLSEGSGAKVVGGISYDSPTIDGMPVRGIGRDNAALLWYKALTERFTTTTNYADARAKTLEVAEELWGFGSAGYNAVADAWAAVGVGGHAQGVVSVLDPGSQVGALNLPVDLRVQAGSENGGALTFSATGLPDGLTIDPATGSISGAYAAPGTSTVTVTAQDSTGAVGSTTFTWVVRTAIFENTTNVAIPDVPGPAVYSDIDVTGQDGNAPSSLQVDVKIIHTARGDLVIDLIAPDGTAYRLKDRVAGDLVDNVIATYTVDASQEPANGTWRLKVQDTSSASIGYIDSWKLTF